VTGTVARYPRRRWSYVPGVWTGAMRGTLAILGQIGEGHAVAVSTVWIL
jgi:hypothetical protein